MAGKSHPGCRLREISSQNSGLLWDLLLRWPRDLPLCLFGMPPDYTVLGLAGSPYSMADLKAMPLDPPRAAPCGQGLPFGRGFMGVLAYSDFDGSGDRTRSFVWKIDAALVFDHRQDRVWLTGDPGEPGAAFRFRGDLETTARGASLPGSAFDPVCEESDEAYLKRVSHSLEDIRAGRYYQINLLRYFKLGAISQQQILRRLQSFAGSAGCWFRDASGEIVSFSPEKFVETGLTPAGLMIHTHPVKGTASRSDDEMADQARAAALSASPKDRAELNMIIDLMRNDLNRICRGGTVRVRDPGRVRSFNTVHHLVGHIAGCPKPGLTMEEFFHALCPAGSITGAPKIEVMQAIRESEGRSRGFFMGNAFIWDPGRGHFDSSVLIRTMVREGSGDYTWAAGSGIVTGSDPELERDEIFTKCRVLTDPF